MDFDDRLRHYFATTDVTSITSETMQAGVERMLVDFGLEQDRTRKFALWALLHTIGAAPDLEAAFDNEEDRNLARDLMELLEQEFSAEGDAAQPDL